MKNSLQKNTPKGVLSTKKIVEKSIKSTNKMRTKYPFGGIFTILTLGYI